MYVGNLPWDCDWRALKDHMSEAGTVNHADVKTGQDGRSRGFGIVKFASAADAENAISNLNGTDIGGREIIVRLDSGGKGGKGDEGGAVRGRGERQYDRGNPYDRGGKGKGKGGGGKGKGGGGKGKGGGGKGKGGGGKPKSAADLDAEMEAYMSGKNGGGGGEEGGFDFGGGRKSKGKPPAADKGGLDDDLDSYMAKKTAPAAEAASAAQE